MPKSTWRDYFRGWKIDEKIQKRVSVRIEEFRPREKRSQKRQNVLQDAEKVVKSRITDLLLILSKNNIDKLSETPEQAEKDLARILPQKEALELARTLARAVARAQKWTPYWKQKRKHEVQQARVADGEFINVPKWYRDKKEKKD